MVIGYLLDRIDLTAESAQNAEEEIDE